MPKVALASAGQGRRGGLRVICYVKSRDGRIWLLAIDSKGAIENIPAHLLKIWKEEFVHGEDD